MGMGRVQTECQDPPWMNATQYSSRIAFFQGEFHSAFAYRRHSDVCVQGNMQKVPTGGEDEKTRVAISDI